MREVMAAVGWGGTAKGELTAEAMVRNRVIAERLGCLDEAGMADLRRGNAPIRAFKYTSKQPRPINQWREQGALALEYYDAGLLSDEAVLGFYKAFEDSHYKTDDGFCGTPKVQRYSYLRTLEDELRKRGVLNP